MASCLSKNRKRSREGEADISTDVATASVDAVSVVPRSYFAGPAPVTYIIDCAGLHRGRVRKKWKILCGEDDAKYLIRKKKNRNDYRPIDCYMALKQILDSRANLAGMVRAIFVKTDNGITFEVKPHVPIPMTCDHFCDLILELLEKSCVRSKDTNERLLRIIDNPITEHLPANSHIVGLSHKATNRMKIGDYISAVGDDVNLVFVVGAIEHGKINTEGLDDLISVSSMSLEAMTIIRIVQSALEHQWNLW